MSYQELENFDSDALRVWFFIFRHVCAALIFYGFVILFGIFEIEEIRFSDFFTDLVYRLILYIFIINVFSSILGRIAAYIILKLIYRSKDQIIPAFREFLTGINGMTFSFFISALLSAFLLVIGIQSILQDLIFNDDSFYASIGAYIILEIMTFFISKLFSKTLMKRMTKITTKVG